VGTVGVPPRTRLDRKVYWGERRSAKRRAGWCLFAEKIFRRRRRAFHLLCNEAAEIEAALEAAGRYSPRYGYRTNKNGVTRDRQGHVVPKARKARAKANENWNVIKSLLHEEAGLSSGPDDPGWLVPLVLFVLDDIASVGAQNPPPSPTEFFRRDDKGNPWFRNKTFRRDCTWLARYCVEPAPTQKELALKARRPVVTVSKALQRTARLLGITLPNRRYGRPRGRARALATRAS